MNDECHRGFGSRYCAVRGGRCGLSLLPRPWGGCVWCALVRVHRHSLAAMQSNAAEPNHELATDPVEKGLVGGRVPLEVLHGGHLLGI